MKLNYLLTGAFALSFLCTGGVAQKSTADLNALNQQILALFQQGKLDDAIPIAEKVVEIEKSKDPQSEMYAVALTNLAVLQKEHFSRLKKSSEAATMAEPEKAASKIRKRAEGAEKNLRAALEVYERRTQTDSLEAAGVKNELAWILSNHLATGTTEDSRARIEEAEKLYTDALGLREKLAGLDSDATLGSVLEFGDFYTHRSHFEKALLLYERYVAAIEKKYGASSKPLVPGLRGLLEIFVITMQDDTAKEMAKRMAAITGRDQPLPSIYPNLDLRAQGTRSMQLPRHVNADPRELFPSRSGAGSMSDRDSALRGAGQMNDPELRFRGIVLVIVVDEEGNVIEARNVDPKVTNVPAIEEAVRSWKFRPFIYKGIARKMRGATIYPYLKN